MGWGEVPILPGQKSEVKHEVKHSEAERHAQEAFMEELREIRVKQTAKNVTSVSDIGQVENMQLPSSWKEGIIQRTGAGTGNFKEYHPVNDPGASMCFYYRGMLTSPEEGSNFHKVLQEAAHHLSQVEIDSLAQTMRNKDADVFSMQDARTEDIKGKRVLIVEGSFHKDKHNQTDTRAIYVDADGTGTAVQEIYYQAPKSSYAKYLKEVQEAMNAIDWK